MTPWTPDTAKHRTAASIHAVDPARQRIAVYDDEHPGHLSLYLTDGENQWPIRTISLHDAARAWEILTSWATTAPLIDHRQTITPALP